MRTELNEELVSTIRDHWPHALKLEDPQAIYRMVTCVAMDLSLVREDGTRWGGEKSPFTTEQVNQLCDSLGDTVRKALKEKFDFEKLLELLITTCCTYGFLKQKESAAA